MLHVLRREGRLDGAFIARHTLGWSAVRAVTADYPPERAAALTGLSAEAIVMAARRFGGARAALTLWSMGVNQSHAGTDKNAAILNLHLATRQIGRPGAGPFSLTGQPNAMGGRETGGLAHLLPGYRTVTDPIARRPVEARWGVAPGTIAPRAPAARRSRSSRAGQRRGARCLDRRHEPGGLDARPRPGGAGRCARPSS